MSNYYVKMILFISLIFFSLMNCSRNQSPVDSWSEANFSIIEVRRDSYGEKTETSAGELAICCRLWELNNSELIYPDPENFDDDVLVLILMRHELHGDIGYDLADQIIPIKKLPASIPIITFFWNSDTLFLNSVKNGEISALFKGEQFNLKEKSKIQFSSSIVTDVLNIGSFSITDTLNVINHGFLATKNY